MARDFSSGNNLGTANNGTSVSTTPLTMLAWVSIDNNNNVFRDIIILDNGTETAYHWLYTQNGLTVVAATDSGGVEVGATKGTLTAAAWGHAGGVWGSTASRIAYCNGAAGTANTTNKTPTGLDTVWIGRGVSSTTDAMDGKIANVGMWDIALNADEVAGFAAGQHPYSGRRYGLKSFWPLNGDASPEIDLIGGISLTLTGSPPKFDSKPLRGGFDQ